MQASYAEIYRDLYERHWWWRAREALLVDVLRERLPAVRPLRILDIGCGDGLFFDRLAEFGTVEGIEPDGSLLDPGGPHRARIHVAPLDERFAPDAPYDVVLLLDVLEHLADPVAALRQALRLLADSGTLVVTVPAFRALWTSHDVINEHVTRFDRRSLALVARDAGARIDVARYFFHWVFPVKFAAHVTQPLLGAEAHLPRIPAPWLNRSLYALSRLEQRTLGRLSLPFGGSLLVMGGHAR